MQTTGTVLLNARGVNINGYDCFVNLSKDTKKDNIEVDHRNSGSGYNTITPSVMGVDTSTLKFSSSSMMLQNHIHTTITSNSIRNDNASDYTVSCFIKTTKTVTFSDSYGSWWELGDSFISHKVTTHSMLNNQYLTSEILILTNASIATSSYWVRTYLNPAKDLTNYWYHFGMTRTNGVSRIFIDGVKYAEISGTSDDLIPSKMNNMELLNYGCKNFYDDLVVISGQALWTSNFTPPTTYLLDSEYAMDLDQVKRRNIIAANVDKKLIIPDDETLKQY